MTSKAADLEDINLRQKGYLDRVYKDALGFAGAKMIRRIVGIAHVADLETIEDKDSRSLSEKRCLLFARHLIVLSQDSKPIVDISEHLAGLANLAKELCSSIPPHEWGK